MALKTTITLAVAIAAASLVSLWPTTRLQAQGCTTPPLLS